jgi:hypothetical protein
LSANSLLLARRSSVSPLITFQAYGSEVRMQSVNAASPISPRCACSIHYRRDRNDSPEGQVVTDSASHMCRYAGRPGRPRIPATGR